MITWCCINQIGCLPLLRLEGMKSTAVYCNAVMTFCNHVLFNRNVFTYLLTKCVFSETDKQRFFAGSLKSSLLQVRACSIHLYQCFLSRGFMSFCTQVGLRSIRSTQGDMWSAAAEQSTPLTRSTYTLFGCMIYELCPRVAGFIFLLLTSPSLRGLAPLWDEGKEKPDFLTLEYIKRVRMSSFFHSDGAGKECV